jgi:crotonobetainyl-CoA:carnitine CoA-transferase CaiB-like acyl-CoA transferase
MNAPLTGIRLLSFEQYGAGPFGTQHLSDLGAEVIKVEPAGSNGDYARMLGPYFTDSDRADKAPHEQASDSSVFFQSFNRNKKSLTLDVTSDEGRGVLHQLVASADAVCNNLRGDVPEKIGITYDQLKSANAAIVCAHCSAYGRTGPRKSWPGFDYLMQAEAGYFHLCGEPESPPARFGLSVVDYMAGQNLAMGLLSGILAAKTSGTGRDVDVNLFDTALCNLSYVANWALNSDYEPVRVERSAHPSVVPCQLYKTSDGWIFLMLNKGSFWPLFCDLIGRGELVTDARFCDFNARFNHRSELTEELDATLSEHTTEHWLSLFGGRIPAAPVLNPRQALDNPFIQQRGNIQELRDSEDNTLQVLAPCIDAGVDRSTDTAAPTLGQHTDEILKSVGFDQSSIDKLRKQNVI